MEKIKPKDKKDEYELDNVDYLLIETLRSLENQVERLANQVGRLATK